MVNTRSAANKLKTEEQPTPYHTPQPQHSVPGAQSVGETKTIQSCAGSVVKTEQNVKNKPPSQSSRHSVKSKKTLSTTSLQAHKKRLELEAAKAKARIEMELIDKQLAADLAELDEYSPPNESEYHGSDVERWVERSQQELELQQATKDTNNKGKLHQSDVNDTNGPVQELATALKQIVTSSAIQQNTNILSRLSTPRELPVFAGNSMEWLQFKQAYEESTEVCTFTDKENLWRLRKCLRGAAHEAVAALLMSATSPATIMSTLELQFGNAECILSRIMTDIKRMSNMSADYHKEIVTFSIKIKNCVAAVRALGREEYLQGMEVATIVLSKLPTILLSKWTDYSFPLITAGCPKSRLDMLSNFLSEEAMKITTCSASLIQSKSDYYRRKQYDSVNNIETVLFTDGQSEQKCRYCRTRIHKLTECKKFKKSMRKDRWQYVKRNAICYKCLLSSHRRETCPAANCDINNCGLPHHRLLHYMPPQNSEPLPVTDPVTETVTYINNNSAVLLKVVPITIRGPSGIVIQTTALLDDGSTLSLISSSLAAQAGLRGRRELLRARGAWDNTELLCETEYVNLSVYGTNETVYNISVRSIDNLNLPKHNLKTVNYQNFEHLKSVSHNLCKQLLQPQVLIGQDNSHLLLSLEIKVGKPDEPCATRTPLGWCLHGRVPTYSPDSVSHYALHITSDTTETECILRDIHEEVRKSFTIESMGIAAKPRENSEDIRARKILEETSILIEGQWHVGLPWRDEKVIMPDSFPTALQRLRGVENKMMKNEEYARRYRERVTHLFENNYAKKLCTTNTSPTTWYLPHFGVDNPNKNKLRLVFDAASKTDGISLNDYLLKGPDLLTSLYGTMLRFRENPVAVSGDIKDMFLRVKVRPEDQNALRFLYRNNPDQPVNTYVMTSLIFGANCSPFIAQFIKNKNAQLYESSMPAAAAAIYTQHYMDDYIDSLPNEETAIKMIRDVTFIHKKGGFEIRNWTSNSKQVLDSLPKETLGTAAVRFQIGQQYEGERTLGLIWYPSDDSLRFDISFKQIPERIIAGTQIPTKREMLRVIMSIFDVYGFLAPYTIIGKIILQETWLLKLNWDDCVTEIIYNKWNKWIKLLKSLRNVRLPRYYLSASEKEDEPVPSARPARALSGAPERTSYRYLQLHVFCDASTKAMCAVAYWRWLHNDSTRVAFITSRCRVAPVKPVSVPRLELQAAVLAARLAETICIEQKIQPHRKVFWCDSSVVLAWIRNDARNYKQYVAHRLGEIDELTSATEWMYVPTKLNVADIATREAYDSNILEKEWLHGPDFLCKNENEWPRDVQMLHEPGNKEIQSEYIHLTYTEKETVYLPVPDVTRFSSWLRLRRATAMIFKFINKCKQITYQFDDTLERAELLLLKHSQLQSFEKEITELRNKRCIPKNSKILNLSPYLDEHDVLRVGGRIGAAAGVSPEIKNPVILEGSCHVAKLIVRYYHHYFAHGNQETVLNEIKQKYWITRLRPAIKTVTSRCMTCRLRKCQPEVPRMGDLPAARMAHHQRPFTYCGVDLFGPMEVSVGRRREKRYGVLFTCLTVRAIHLEVVATLTSDSFIMSLRRMAARRGWPQYMYSDNGTNLRGAETELKKAIKGLDEEVLKNEALNHGTKWTFIPPASPHWGGAWERLIRSVKTSLRVVLNERAPKDETLNTLLAEIENMVNSRPLTHVSVDAKDPETLTPNHFLLGSSSSLPHIGTFNDSDLYLRKQWRTAQRLADMYWRRWVREILPDMLPRTKWQRESRSLQEGDLVLIVDPDSPRNMWHRGLIKEVVVGKDGRVRAVKVNTKTGLKVRSASRVARLPIVNECC